MFIKHNLISLLYINTITNPSQGRRDNSRTRPPLPHQILPKFVNPEHRARNTNQTNQVPKFQTLGLKHVLQKGQVYDAGLTEQGAQDGIIEHFVSGQGHLAAEDGLGFTSAGEGVEHVEEDETGECHGGVAAGDDAGTDAGDFVCVVGHFVDVDGQGAEHYYGGGCEDAAKEGFGEDAGVFGSWGAEHYGWVDGFYSQGLSGGSVHEGVQRGGWLVVKGFDLCI